MVSNIIYTIVEDNNYCLIVKIHPKLGKNVEMKNFFRNLGASVINVIDITDVQELLIISDAVISDISSLSLDYLLYSSNIDIKAPKNELS